MESMECLAFFPIRAKAVAYGSQTARSPQTARARPALTSAGRRLDYSVPGNRSRQGRRQHRRPHAARRRPRPARPRQRDVTHLNRACNGYFALVPPRSR